MGRRSQDSRRLVRFWVGTQIRVYQFRFGSNQYASIICYFCAWLPFCFVVHSAFICCWTVVGRAWYLFTWKQDAVKLLETFGTEQDLLITRSNLFAQFTATRFQVPLTVLEIFYGMNISPSFFGMCVSWKIGQPGSTSGAAVYRVPEIDGAPER
jgi:hypothetical protein